jgi:hypothetical protein
MPKRALFAAAIAGMIGAADAGPAPGEPVLVELFTSQSCSSCPPAEAIFRRLAARADVVALEWHVDYWDGLNVGGAGRWKDPFASPAHSARQRAYNEALRGTSSVYTPQAVIAGQLETVGSRADDISALIDRQRRMTSPARLVVDGAALTIAAAPAEAQARFVIFQRTAATSVAGGENKGARLSSSNVVVRVLPAEKARAGDRRTLPKLGAGEGCALVIEDARRGVALAAAYCPG